MRSRLLRLAAAGPAVALLASACAPATGIATDVRIQKQDRGFLVSVVDSLQDAGRSPSVALEKDGNPAVAYLMYVPVLKKGEIPPAIIATEPQPPAVMLATESKGIWSRVSVTPQNTSPLKGEAPEIADQDGHAIPGVNTALAIDPSGVHHVIWSTPSGLFYSSDGGASFGDPQKVVATPTYGGSIAISSTGDPWISYFGSNVVRVAHPSGDSWTTEDVATISVPPTTSGLQTSIRFSNGTTLVGFGDGSQTQLATNSGSTWTTETIPGNGGLAVSLATDKGGNRHLAYYDATGTVSHAEKAGASWNVEQLAQVGAPTPSPSASASGSARPGAPPGMGDPRWGTSIAVTDDGVDYVAYADTKDGRVVLLSNEGGSFAERPIEGEQGGATPSVAVSADGSKVVMAWFDAINADLAVAEPAGGSFVLAHSPPPTSPPAVTPPVAECVPEGGTKLMITAPAGAAGSGFDKACLAMDPGVAFTVTFVDDDTGVPHNWHLYTDASASQSLGGAPSPGDILIGPDQVDYQIGALDPGTFYYRCDVHPTTMQGTFVVPGK